MISSKPQWDWRTHKSYSEEKKQQRLACGELTRHLHLWRFVSWISDASQRDFGRAPAHCVTGLHLMPSFLLPSLFSSWYLTEFFLRWRAGWLVLWSCGKQRPGRKERERPDFPSFNFTLFLNAVPAASWSGHGWRVTWPSALLCCQNTFCAFHKSTFLFFGTFCVWKHTFSEWRESSLTHSICERRLSETKLVCTADLMRRSEYIYTL